MNIMEKTWKRGKVLITPQTRLWSKEDIDREQVEEEKRIFSNFSSVDAGRGREWVCTLNEHSRDFEYNRGLIELAPILKEKLLTLLSSEGFNLGEEGLLKQIEELDNLKYKPTPVKSRYDKSIGDIFK